MSNLKQAMPYLKSVRVWALLVGTLAWVGVLVSLPYRLQDYGKLGFFVLWFLIIALTKAPAVPVDQEALK